MSNRKPYNQEAGYIASRHNAINGEWVVIYEAAKQNLDVEGKYAAVCKKHGSVVGVRSLASARPLLKIPDFCGEC